MGDFLKSQADFIFSFYGLAFILLSLVCLKLNRLPQRYLPWGWLGLFGLMHGINEWLDLVVLISPELVILNLIRICLLSLSFLFLIEFGRAATASEYGKGPGRWIFIPLLGMFLLGAIAGLPGLFVSARYALGLVGGLWAAWALFVAPQAFKRHMGMLPQAGWGMAIYALATGLVANEAPFPLASFLNYDAWLTGPGLPIHLIRVLSVMWITLSLWQFAQSEKTDPQSYAWRRKLLWGTIAGLILILLLGWFRTQSLGNKALQEVRTENEYLGELLEQVLSDRIQATDRAVQSMAGSPWIIPALIDRQSKTLDQANSVLDRYSHSLTSSVCYLMDLQGIVIASSNRSGPDSFVGKNYGFRPYFQKPREGSSAWFVALGITSQERGYYSGYPVRDPEGKIAGVAVIKKSIGKVEELFHQPSPVFLIDPHGIVFLTNRPEMLMQSLWPLSPDTARELMASQQFGPGPFVPILAQAPADRSECLFEGKRLLVMRKPLLQEGWSLVVLISPQPIAYARLLGISVTLILGFLLIGVACFVDMTIESNARIRKELSERQQAETTLQKVIDNAPIGIYIVQQGIIKMVNPGFEKITGFAEQELLGKPPLSLVLPDFQAKVRGNAIKMLQGERHFPYEYQVMNKQGEKKWIMEAVTSISLTGQRATLGYFMDITHRRTVEEALTRSEITLETIVEAAPIGIGLVVNRTFQWANENMADLTGYASKELIGLNARLLYPGDEEFERVGDKLYADILVTGKETLETRWKRRDGNIIDVFLSASPLDLTDLAAGVVLTAMDVTERKLLEYQLAASQRMEAIGLLAGGVAHDFNNILSAIMGYSDIMMMDLERDDPVSAYTKEIMKAAHRGNSLTHQLLAFSRKQILQPRALQINEVVKGMGMLLHRLIGEDIDLVTVLEANIGCINADPGQMEQIIMNLVVNARDAMPQGGKITIETATTFLDEEYGRSHRAVSPGFYVVLMVSDNGAGMDAATKDHIFEPFFTTKALGKGTGLGLATVYGIVKQSGGHIWVYSELGQGTTFKIYLPRMEAAVPVTAKPQAYAATSLHGVETILVVEDDEALKAVTAQALEKFGYKVLLAGHGEDALSICEQYPATIHLMLTDVVMPQMSGGELAKRLKSLCPAIKVLYMSGYTDNAIVHHGVLDKGLAFLQKPFKVNTLIAKIRQILDAS